MVTQYSMGVFRQNFHKGLGVFKKVLVLFQKVLVLFKKYLDSFAAGVAFSLMYNPSPHVVPV